MGVSRRHLLWASFGLLAGCGKGGRRGGGMRLDLAVAPAAETLLGLLLGAPDRTDPQADPPLLTASGRTKVVVAVDAEGFARTIAGRVKASDIRQVESALVDAVRKRIARRGFVVESAPFPAKATDAATIAATLEPLTEPGASRRDGVRATLLLIRLTLTDASGAILARRDFYSGYDLEQLRDERPMDGASGRPLQ